MSNRLLILALLIAAPPAAGKVEISLPLGGYYRTGKYMPVRLQASGEPERFYNLILRGDGAMTTLVKAPDQVVDTVVPLLVVDERLRRLSWGFDWKPDVGSIDPALTNLTHDQRLVGFDRLDLEFARQVFPGSSIVPLRLDEVGRMPNGPNGVWQTFDLLVFDRPVDVTNMVLCGVSVAVRSPQRPDDKWPWEKTGDYWLYRPQTRGPQTAGLNPKVFSPVQGWHPQLPFQLRRRLLLFATVFSILLLGATLAPRRWRLPLALALALAATGLFAASGRWIQPAQWRPGIVLVELDRPVAHLDWWVYSASLRPTPLSHPCRGLVMPFWESSADFEKLDLTLFCTADGKMMTLTYKLEPGLRLAVMDRQEDATGALGTGTSPPPDLSRLIDRVYRNSGDKVTSLSDGHSFRDLLWGVEPLGGAKIVPAGD